MNAEDLPDRRLNELDATSLFAEAQRCHQEAVRLKTEPMLDELSDHAARRAALCLRLWMKKTGRDARSFAKEIGLSKPPPRPAQRPPKTVSARVFSRWGRGR